MFCDDCDEWRTVRQAQKSVADPVKKCRQHMRRRPALIGNKVRTGAGYVQVRTEKGYEYEHRVAWEAVHGPIPPGYHVHHVNHVRDDNRLENLELVLGRRHNRDHTQERHNVRALDNRGSRSGKWAADLDNDDIVTRRNGGESFRSIARDYGVSHQTVANHYRRAVEGLA